MLFWLNEKIEKNNIIILSKQAILVSSCKRGACQSVRTQLEKKVSPVKLFGKANLSMIPLIKIQGINNQPEAPILEITIGINNEGKEKTVKLAFSDNVSRDKCSAFIKKLRLNATQLNTTQATQKNQKPTLSANTRQTELQQRELQQTEQPHQKEPRQKEWQPKVAKPYESSNPYEPVNINHSADEVFEYEEVKVKNKFKHLKTDFFQKKFMLPAALAPIAIVAALYFLQGTPDALYEAIQSQKITTQELNKLLEKGADINYRGVDGVTPILSAINHGNEDIVVSLINKGADLSNKYNGETALDMAIDNGLDKAVFSMLNKKAPTANNKDLLTRAIKNRLSTSSVKKIISLGADVNYRNENGSSPLATALLFTAKKNIIQLLLSKGASTKIKVNGLSPVMFVRTRGREDLSKLISRYD